MDTYGQMPMVLQITVAIVVVMLGVAVILVAVPWALRMITPEEEEEEDETFGQELNLEIKVVNKFGDTAPTAGNLYVYALDGRILDNDNTTTGIVTTTGKYEPGEFVNLKLVFTNYQTRWILNHEVERAVIPTATTDYEEYEVVCSPTISVKVEDPTGTEIASENDYAKSTASKPTMTFTIRNTLDDSGWLDTYDPHLNMDYKVAFFIRLQNSADNERGLDESIGAGFDRIIITAPLSVRSWASQTTYYGDIPSTNVVRDIAVDFTVLSPGIWSVQVTFDMTGWTDNNVRVD